MEFDWKRIPSLLHSFDSRAYALTPLRYPEIQLVSESISGAQGALETLAQGTTLAFKPHFGWQGHVELETRNAA